EGKKEYGKRMGTVEPVFGILKKQHNLNELEQRELDRIPPELNLMAAAYNIKQLHAHKTKKGKEKERILEKNLQDFQKDFQAKFPNINHQIKYVNQKKKKT
ncbi:MAG: transposase, partial [Methanobacteriaceae archaeon]